MISNSSSPQQPHDDASDNDEISWLDLLGVMAENLRLLIIAPIIAGFIALAYAYTLTPIFTAKTTIIPPSKGSSSSASGLLGQLGNLSPIVGSAAGIGSQAEEYKAFLESNSLRDQLIDQFKLMQHYKSKYYEQARGSLDANTVVAVNKKSNLIVIEVSDQDPQFAANLANAYVIALSQMLGKMALEDAKYRRQMLEQQINEATEKSYRSPIVREAIIQSVVREYETAIFDQKKDRPFIQQVDKAEVPNIKSKPKRAQIAIITALITGFSLLIYVFILGIYRSAKENPETKVRLQNIFVVLRRQLPW